MPAVLTTTVIFSAGVRVGAITAIDCPKVSRMLKAPWRSLAPAVTGVVVVPVVALIV
jgi:hypothetical protein